MLRHQDRRLHTKHKPHLRQHTCHCLRLRKSGQRGRLRCCKCSGCAVRRRALQVSRWRMACFWRPTGQQAETRVGCCLLQRGSAAWCLVAMDIS